MSIGRLLRNGRGGSERRKSPRTRCRLHCTLRLGRRQIRARVLDVSEGGLCLLSPVALRPKQEVTLQIDVPPHGPVTVEAVAWHVRKLKTAPASTFSVGMMISKAGEGFRALLPGGDGRAVGGEQVAEALAQIAAQAPQPDGELQEDADLGLGEQDALPETGLEVFRVRVKATQGPRTRTLTLSAGSAVEAEALARADLDDTWQILEVVPVDDLSA